MCHKRSKKGKNDSDRVTCYQQPIYADTTDGSHANLGSTGHIQIVNQTLYAPKLYRPKLKTQSDTD